MLLGLLFVAAAEIVATRLLLVICLLPFASFIIISICFFTAELLFMVACRATKVASKSN